MAADPSAAPRSPTVRPRPRPLARLADLVLSTHPRIRSRAGMSLLVSLLYVCWSAAEAYCARTGLMDAQAARWMIAVNLIGAVAFWPFIRSGLSLRTGDASLVLPQMVYAVGAIVLGYALVPVLRAPLLQLLCLVPLYALLNLHPRQAAWMGGWIVGLLLVMLAVMTHLGRADFHPQAEALRIALAAFVVVSLTLNAMHFGRVRLQLKAQRAELQEAVARVQDLVIHDPLTGLFNRQHMQALLEEEAARQDRSGQPMTVALIDLDLFKRINDTHGHAAGDAVLAGFAELARARLRETDAVARWGGEEFLILLRETDIRAPALAALERLREQLRERALVPGAPQVRVDYSAGIAARQPGETLSALLERADRALYEAKAAGRGVNVFAPEGRDAPVPRSTCA